MLSRQWVYHKTNGDLDVDKCENEIKTVFSQSEFGIPDEGISQLLMPIEALFVFEVIVFSKRLMTDSNDYSFAIKCGFLFFVVVISILSIVLLAVILYNKSNSVLHDANKQCQELKNQVYNEHSQVLLELKRLKIEELNTECSSCISIRERNVLNAYNLFTYEQILNIEESVGDSSGDNRKVYSYSTYLDDGEGVGIAAAEKVVRKNIEKGVKYFEFFYLNQEKLHMESTSNEVFVDLSEVLGKEEIKKCLDYMFYKDCRFDIMIYQWDDNRIEGYYCLNFPLIKECQRSRSCTIDCTKANTDRTGKVFYKKMSPSLAYGLQQRLSMILKARNIIGG